jgi:hypothetical protein
VNREYGIRLRDTSFNRRTTYTGAKMFSKVIVGLSVLFASYVSFGQTPQGLAQADVTSTSAAHEGPSIKLAQAWDSRGYGNCISVGSDNVGPLLTNKCDAYLAVVYTDDNQCRIGCKVYVHAHDSERITSPHVHHVEACRSPAIPHLQTDGTYICKP